MLNSFSGVGRLELDPKLLKTPNGKDYAKMIISILVVHCRKDALQRIIYLRAASESAEQHLSAYRLYGGIINSWRNET